MTGNYQHYWRMANPQKGASSDFGKMSGFGPAPKMEPVNKLINVKDGHHWTESPVTSRREVPVLKLTELRILSNPMLNQLANNIMVAIGSGARIEEEATIMGSAVVDAFKVIKAALTSTSSENKGGDNQAAQLRKASTDLKQALGNMLTSNTKSTTDMRNVDPMRPYDFLYTVRPTNFKYILPYMENMYKSLSNSFTDSAEGPTGMAGSLGSMASIATEFLSNISLRKLREPGIMIEKPKAFNFEGRERSYTVMFPLFNTKDYGEIVKNWQFLFLLVYQNTPNRITRDLIDPPCIYQASIPGVWYSKYSAITNMTVNFKGARRTMDIPVNFITGQKEISTIIPDAYEVSLTVTELFAETQNFLFENIRINTDDNISVKYKDASQL